MLPVPHEDSNKGGCRQSVCAGRASVCCADRTGALWSSRWSCTHAAQAARTQRRPPRRTMARCRAPTMSSLRSCRSPVRVFAQAFTGLRLVCIQTRPENCSALFRRQGKLTTSTLAQPHIITPLSSGIFDADVTGKSAACVCTDAQCQRQLPTLYSKLHFWMRVQDRMKTHSTAMTQTRKIAQNRIWHLLLRGTPRHFSKPRW